MRPLVFAAGSTEGFIYVFDLSRSISAPIVQLECPSEESKKNKNRSKSLQKRPGVTKISFNQKQRDLLAASDSSGKIHIWRLNWQLSNKNSNEEEIFEELIKKV